MQKNLFSRFDKVWYYDIYLNQEVPSIVMDSDNNKYYKIGKFLMGLWSIEENIDQDDLTERNESISDLIYSIRSS